MVLTKEEKASLDLTIRSGLGQYEELFNVDPNKYYSEILKFSRSARAKLKASHVL